MLGLIYVPLLVYLATFYVHFMVLSQSGPGDTFMSTPFQRTLEGSDVLSKSLSKWVVAASSVGCQPAR